MPTTTLITHVSLVTLMVPGPPLDEGMAFYVDKLGFVAGDDVSMGNWLVLVEHRPYSAEDIES